MAELDAKQVYSSVMPLIAIVLMASGVLVNTVPLESKRPSDPERARFSHAGRQDIQARLWQDPFGALSHIKGTSPEKRCLEALEDSAHHIRTLKESVHHRSASRGREVSVLPVMVPGGPYFEDGEARRRSRYAVINALLNSGWAPEEEDKLGYVWTFESCVEAPYQRRAPELIPYEWFDYHRDSAANEPHRALLVLWIDEDAVARRPLEGIERTVQRLAYGGVLCEGRATNDASARQRKADKGLAGLLAKKGLCIEAGEPLKAQHCRDFPAAAGAAPRPWCETRVIGPARSATLEGVARDLVRDFVPDRARTDRPAAPGPWLRFYSSGATAPIRDEQLRAIIDDVGRAAKRDDPGSTSPDVRALRQRFEERVLRLTVTDDRLAGAFVDEIRLRIVQPTLFGGLRARGRETDPLCAGRVVIVSEGDTSYAREFRKLLDSRLFGCADDLVVPVHYLRGLDGVLPEGAGAPVPATDGTHARSGEGKTGSGGQATPERSDGRGQYDYLRRLTERLTDLDQDEKRRGRAGVLAIGVLGNDAYDKILVLDALRDRFPGVVFFAADLDARLLDAGAIRSTRNLVVASAYGLSLNRGVQAAAPPFRDTYQTGTYLSTLVALNRETNGQDSGAFARWFEAPRLFEIGRTRAIRLTREPGEPCAAADPRHCGNIHDTQEGQGLAPAPRLSVVLACLLAAGAALAFGLLYSATVRGILAGFRLRRTRRHAAVAMALLLLVGIGCYLVGRDIDAGDGEPFAWFEGISIWPTQILRLAILLVTIALLYYGRLRLRRSLAEVAKDFGLPPLDEQEFRKPTAPGSMCRRIAGLWSIGCSTGAGAGAVPQAQDSSSWFVYLERMRARPTLARIAIATGLFLALGLAVLSLGWPNSPHRGLVAAWIDHLLLLALLVGATVLLAAALDATWAAARLFQSLDPRGAVFAAGEPAEPALWRRYPVGERACRLWTRFRMAVRVALAVNGLIYLPLIVLALIVPTRSRVFDAWDFPLAYAALLTIGIVLAVSCAMHLRRTADRLKKDVLDEIEAEAERFEFAAETAQAPAPRLKARLLRRIAEQIRAERRGPLGPISLEPAVRATMIVLGGAGASSTAEFLLLSRT